MAHVAGYKVEAAQFQSGQPVDASAPQLFLEDFWESFAWAQGDQWDFNAVEAEQVMCAVDAARIRHQENHRKASELTRVQVWGDFVREERQADVHVLGEDHGLDLALAPLAENKGKAMDSLTHAKQQFREIFPLHNLGGGNAQAFLHAAPETFFQGGQLGEEGMDMIMERLAFRRELEGAALKERDAESSLELEDLGADGGLLNAVRNVS